MVVDTVIGLRMQDFHTVDDGGHVVRACRQQVTRQQVEFVPPDAVHDMKRAVVPLSSNDGVDVLTDVEYPRFGVQ